MKDSHNFKPELVAPAQDWSSLKQLSGLADAVYFGVQQFNMRAKARNFNLEDIPNITKFCKNNNMKSYLCTNILIYDSELEQLYNLIRKAKENKIDAIIAHDFASINFAKKIGINFHISTQANVSNIEAARYYESLGAESIVLARELSLTQIKEIKSNLNRVKAECFVHGSLCTAISGRCYLSATLYNDSRQSANRGNCSQPCRRSWTVIDDMNNQLVYDGEMFLNAKDLRMIEYIPELIDIQIDAFKIEGRMKDSLYTYIVTKCYREAIDSFFEGDYTPNKIKYWIKELSKVFNRGFHTGFFFGRPTPAEIERKRRGNVSPYKKEYIGKILAYDKKSKSANISLEHLKHPLVLGSEIIIESKESSHIEKLNKIILKGKKVKMILPNAESVIKVNIPIKSEVCCKDKIYILTLN